MKSMLNLFGVYIQFKTRNIIYILTFLSLCLILSMSESALADSLIDYNYYMDDWNTNISLAKEYLKETQIALEQGDTLAACSSQRKASQYGIEATESLIKAMKINGKTDGIENFVSGLNKWRELGDFCG